MKDIPCITNTSKKVRWVVFDYGEALGYCTSKKKAIREGLKITDTNAELLSPIPKEFEGKEILTGEFGIAKWKPGSPLPDYEEEVSFWEVEGKRFLEPQTN